MYLCSIDFFSHVGKYMGAMMVEGKFLEDLVADLRFVQVRLTIS